jgi:hypothetical protein
MQSAPTEVSCAVEVFVATALLHYEQPNRPEFTIQEIVRRAAQENITGEMRSGVSVHASQHCVANKAPNPNRHKMLFASGRNTRRLLLPGDEIHPERTGKTFPDAGEVPERYLPLLEWTKERFKGFEQRQSSPSQVTSANSGVTLPNRLQSLLDAKRIGISAEKNIRAPGVPSSQGTGSNTWLGDLLELRLAGAHLADGTDPDEYVRQLREGWD